MSEAQRAKQEESVEGRQQQEAVRAQTFKIRQHVRTRVTKLSNKVEEFQHAFVGEAAEEAVAFSKLAALHGTLEPLAKQLIKLDIEVLDTYQADFESEDLQAEEEEKAAEYEALVFEMEAYFIVLSDNQKVKIEVQLNTSKVAIPTTPGMPFAPVATSTPGPAGGAGVGGHTPSLSHVKLPYLKLPEFSGILTEWASFHDRFMEVLDKGTSCAPAYKLEYLKGCLKGEPLKLLQG